MIFVPAHLAEEVVEKSERTILRDQFGHQRLREGKYTPGQIDIQWTAEIEKDFTQWLIKHRDDPQMPRETIQQMIKERAGDNN